MDRTALSGQRARGRGELAARFQGLYRFLLNKWWFDELYDAIFVKQ